MKPASPVVLTHRFHDPEANASSLFTPPSLGPHSGDRVYRAAQPVSCPPWRAVGSPSDLYQTPLDSRVRQESCWYSSDSTVTARASAQEPPAHSLLAAASPEAWGEVCARHCPPAKGTGCPLTSPTARPCPSTCQATGTPRAQGRSGVPRSLFCSPSLVWQGLSFPTSLSSRRLRLLAQFLAQPALLPAPQGLDPV